MAMRTSTHSRRLPAIDGITDVPGLMTAMQRLRAVPPSRTDRESSAWCRTELRLVKALAKAKPRNLVEFSMKLSECVRRVLATVCHGSLTNGEIALAEAVSLDLGELLGLSAMRAAVTARPASSCASSAPEGNDAELIRLCGEYVERDRASTELGCRAEETADGPEKAALGRRSEEIGATLDERRLQIAALPSSSVAGLRAKAQTVAQYWENQPPDECELAWSLVQDLIREDGSVPAVADEPLPDSGPDAKLIRLCEIVAALDEECEVLGDRPHYGHPGNAEALRVNGDCWQKFAARAAAMPAHTLAGIRARAKAIGAVTLNQLPELTGSASGPEVDMLKMLARDLLAGRAA